MPVRVKIQTKDGYKIVNLNRRRAVREKCLECSAWVPSEVRNCEFDDCQLYPFRSNRGHQDAKARNKAIRQYCLWCMNGQNGEVSKCPSLDCSLFAYRKSRTDRSAEIESLSKKGHIEVCFEDKTENEYQNIWSAPKG